MSPPGGAEQYERGLHVGFWRDCVARGVEQKFSEPLMRFAGGDVRDHID
jgi:hypothetical protein